MNLNLMLLAVISVGAMDEEGKEVILSNSAVRMRNILAGIFITIFFIHFAFFRNYLDSSQKQQRNKTPRTIEEIMSEINIHLSLLGVINYGWKQWRKLLNEQLRGKQKDYKARNADVLMYQRI